MENTAIMLVNLSGYLMLTWLRKRLPFCI